MPAPQLVTAKNQPSSTPPAEAAIRTLVVTDLVDSTRMVARLGDTRAAEVATHHDREARDLLRRFNGLEIDKTDGFLLLFERPIDAVVYALTYHQTLAGLSRELEVELEARVGIHLGEVLLRQNSPADVARGAKRIEVEGLAKPTTARIMSLAIGQQTLLTHSAFDLARRSAVGTALPSDQVSWQAHGLYQFKGVEEPLEVFEVGAVGLAPLAVPPDTEKAHRVVADSHEPILGWRPAPEQPVPLRPNWMLKERIGSGGFGEVWLATQQKTGDNRVFKFCLEANRLRSLQREVTLFRLLKETLGHRDDIARVLDWNFEEAPYFLESEYTEGGNLAEWAKEQGGLAAIPLEVRLELVAQTADALAAAHSVGVLHKDIKPTNILVTTDRQGRPKARLTDFGIGRVDESVLAEHGITRLGLTEVITPNDLGGASGTFVYMAPEVFEGKAATIQADIYALGIILYQMVTGDFAHPLSPGWRRDIPDEILADDIAQIVDGSAERRPASASEVADRLRRLDNRRAEAQRRQEHETAHRRRKLYASFGALAMVVLLMVSILAVQATQARREADLRRGQAEDLIGFMLGDLRKKLEPLGRLDILGAVGDKAMDYFRAVPESDLTDGEIFRRSEALLHIGRVRKSEGNPEAAVDAFEESLALTQELVSRDSENVEWQKGLATRHFWIGNILWDQGDLDGALERFQTQLGIARELVEKDPEDFKLRVNVAFAQNNIGFVQEARGDLEGALEAYRETLGIKQGLVALDPESTRQLRTLASSHNATGSALLKLGELDAALEHFYAEQEIVLDVIAKDPASTRTQRQLLISHNYIGRALEAKGDREGAREHYQASLGIAEALVEIDPTQTDWQRNLAAAHRRAGLDFLARHDYENARAHVEDARAILAELFAKDPTKAGFQREFANSHSSVGEVLAARGDAEGALAEARAALALLMPLIEKNPQDRRSHSGLIEAPW